MAILLYIVFFAVIPFTALSFIKNRAVAFLGAWLAGGILLVWRMIYLEARAVDSDFDLMFLFSLVVWFAGVGVIYLIYFFIHGLLIKRLSHWRDLRSKSVEK